MTKIKTEGAVTKKDVLKYASERGYDIDTFLEYLKYQKNATEQLEEYKIAAEECALLNPELDMSVNKDLEWYSNWMGFGGRYYIPREYHFDTYCVKNDIYMHSLHNYDIVKRNESDAAIYVFRDDNGQCFKINKDKDVFGLYFRSKQKLDLEEYDQGKSLAISMVANCKDDEFCKILENFYNNLEGEPISFKYEYVKEGNIEVISGSKGYSLFAEVDYSKYTPFSISLNIDKENEAYPKIKTLYADLDKSSKIEENIDERIKHLKVKA